VTPAQPAAPAEHPATAPAAHPVAVVHPAAAPAAHVVSTGRVAPAAVTHSSASDAELAYTGADLGAPFALGLLALAAGLGLTTASRRRRLQEV